MTSRKRVSWLALCAALGAACATSERNRERDVDLPSDQAPPLGGFDGGSAEGAGPPVCAATTLAAKRDPIDIIIVVDNSGSMVREMRLIQDALNQFSANVESYGLDYRVILITWRGDLPGTTLCVPPPLGGPGCGDNLPRFSHTNWQVESHDAFQVLLTTYDMQENWGTAHTPPLVAAERWDKRLRPDAWKAIVVFSDEEFRVSNYFGPLAVTGWASFEAALLARKPASIFGTAAKRRYSFHSVVNYVSGTLPSSRITCDEDNDVFPDDYIELSKRTNGLVASVCDQDYRHNVFDKIAASIKSQVACEIPIPEVEAKVVDPTTVAIVFTPEAGKPSRLTQISDASKCGAAVDGWYYDANAAPTRAILCPEACARVNATDAKSLSLAVGCKVPPPR